MKRGVFVAVIAVGIAAPAVWPMPDRESAGYEGADMGPADARRVYWVGHSLMSSRDPNVPNGPNLIETVGELARAAGLRYEAFDHTLWGSPLSLAYRGRSHAGRREPELASRRAALDRDRYDTLVLTDTVPIDAARRYEHSSYYAARFACDVLQREPAARIYLYESWVGLQGVADAAPPHTWDWGARLLVERRGYEALADEVSAGQLPEPGFFGRWTRWWSRTCRPGPVFLVPVGTAFRALATALADGSWVREDGSRILLEDFFVNPYVDWPSEWPDASLDEASARARVAGLMLRHPEREVDDIHPSALGIYFAGLVHYATLYRRSPEGLPPVEALDRVESLRLQRLVWDVVRNDARAGVE